MRVPLSTDSPNCSRGSTAARRGARGCPARSSAAISALAARRRSESSITSSGRSAGCGRCSTRKSALADRADFDVGQRLDRRQRSDESNIAISPKKSPSLRIERIVSRPSGPIRQTATEPLTRMKNVFPGSPSRTTKSCFEIAPIGDGRQDLRQLLLVELSEQRDTPKRRNVDHRPARLQEVPAYQPLWQPGSYTRQVERTSTTWSASHLDPAPDRRRR